MKRKPPEELVEARPGLANEEDVFHPSTGESLGKAPKYYTKAVHDVIVSELSKGQRPQGACARAGIVLATFYEWIRRGKDNDPWFYEFAHDVEIAYNLAEAKAVDTIMTAGEDGTMTAEDAKWWLERARADGYSKQVKQLVENQVAELLLRLEMVLEPHIFEQVLAVAVGGGPNPAQLNAKPKSSD